MLEMSISDTSQESGSNPERLEIDTNPVSLESVIFEIKNFDKKDSSKSNIVSGLKKMIAKGLINENNLEEQFLSEFSITLNNVKHYVNTQDKKKNSWPSFLNDIRLAVDSVVRFDVSKMTLGESLYIIAQRKWGRKTSKSAASVLLKDLYESGNNKKIALNSIQNWIYGKQTPVKKKSCEVIRFFDDYFNLNDSLSDKVPSPDYFLKETERERKEPKIEIPELLFADINDFLNWKIHRKLPNQRAYSHFSIPRDKKRRMPKSPRDNEWTLDENKNTPQRENFLSQCRMFIKYLKDTDYKKDGMDNEKTIKNLRFYDFFDENAIEQIHSWAKKRGVFTSVKLFLDTLNCECKEDSYTALFVSLPTIETFDLWKEHLNLLSRYEIETSIKEILAAKNKSNPDDIKAKKNIQPILNSKNPKEVLKKISLELKKKAGTHSYLSYNHLTALRTSLFFSLELVRPVRVKNLSDMEYIPGDLSDFDIKKIQTERKCALYKRKEDGLFYFFVHKKHLKNRGNKNIVSVIQSFPGLTSEIENYLNYRKLYLKKYNTNSRWLFCGFKPLKSEVVVGYKSLARSLGCALSNATKKVTRALYLKEDEQLICAINPHAMRHLIATLYLWDHPENYGALATLLMDDLKTVMDTYADLNHGKNSKDIANWSLGWGEAA